MFKKKKAIKRRPTRLSAEVRTAFAKSRATTRCSGRTPTSSVTCTNSIRNHSKRMEVIAMPASRFTAILLAVIAGALPSLALAQSDSVLIERRICAADHRSADFGHVRARGQQQPERDLRSDLQQPPTPRPPSRARRLSLSWSRTARPRSKRIRPPKTTASSGRPGPAWRDLHRCVRDVLHGQRAHGHGLQRSRRWRFDYERDLDQEFCLISDRPGSGGPQLHERR